MVRRKTKPVKVLRRKTKLLTFLRRKTKGKFVPRGGGSKLEYGRILMGTSES